MTQQIKWTKKDLLTLEELSKEELLLILDTAVSFKEVVTRQVKKVPALRGKTIANLFFEPSTRTRISFELAGKRLSADTLNISAAQSSVKKGETLIDMGKNIEAMNVDIIIVRHASSGAPYLLAKELNAAIVNAGDGMHEHPTQGLLDIYTIRDEKGTLEGLNVSIIGDILFSRVARSNIWGLTKLGANVTVCGPKTLIPIDIDKMGVKVTYDVDEAIKDADVLINLRVQLERQSSGLFPSIREYSEKFCITKDRLKKAKDNILIMHPGPMNRGIEIMPDIADSDKSVILDQVTNGVAVRMAALYLISGVKAH